MNTLTTILSAQPSHDQALYDFGTRSAYLRGFEAMRSIAINALKQETRKMASINEINAAFDVINVELHRLVYEHVPGFFQSRVLYELDGPEGRKRVVNGIRLGLEAAERIRKEEQT